MTTSSSTKKVPWLPLIAAAVLVPLLLTALATCTGVGERESVESDLKARSQQALDAAGISGASVDFNGRDGTISGVSADQQDAAQQAVDKVEGVRVAEVSGSGGEGEGEGSDGQAGGEPTDKAALQKEIAALIAKQAINFETPGAELTPGGDATVQEIAALLKDAPDVQIRVDGHVTGRRNSSTGQQVSEERANAVKDRLVELGVPADAISTKGFGAGKPLQDNKTPEGQAANRRVEIKVL
jgi:outer membrane protein OmpA-like peptidoglycan-associated protein